MRPLSVIAAVALPIGGAVATSPALRAPALAVSGSSVLGIRCVCVATGVGVGLGVDAGRRGLSNALARGMFAAYGTMGLAGLITLGVMSALIFPDGYRKVRPLVFASAITLAATNVGVGLVIARWLLRLTWGASAHRAFIALAASPSLLLPAEVIQSTFGRVLGGG